MLDEDRTADAYFAARDAGRFAADARAAEPFAADGFAADRFVAGLFVVGLRPACCAVVRAAAAAVRPVVVAARLAVDAVARADFRVVVAVPFAPADAAFNVLEAPDAAALTVRSPTLLASEATERTDLARERAADEPVGDATRVFLPRTRAMKSWAAETPP